MAERVLAPKRMLIAWATGLVWSQAAAAVALLWLPPRAALLADGMAEGWVATARWTLLAPVTLAQWGMQAQGAPRDSLFSLLLAADALATILVFAAAWSLSRLSRPGRDVCALVLAAALFACGIGGWLQLDRAQRAESEFFSFVSRVEVPWLDAPTVQAAEKFAATHPESRWAGEALRISAMSQVAAERWSEAARVWRRFDLRFAGTGLPGEAYAEYRLGECDEGLGRMREAIAHYRAAVSLLESRTDGIQQWVAADAAKRVGRLERRRGLVAVAGYWNERSRALNAARLDE